jgi:hypothetical protein
VGATPRKVLMTVCAIDPMLCTKVGMVGKVESTCELR